MEEKKYLYGRNVKVGEIREHMRDLFQEEVEGYDFRLGQFVRMHKWQVVSGLSYYMRFVNPENSKDIIALHFEFSLARIYFHRSNSYSSLPCGRFLPLCSGESKYMYFKSEGGKLEVGLLKNGALCRGAADASQLAKAYSFCSADEQLQNFFWSCGGNFEVETIGKKITEKYYVVSSPKVSELVLKINRQADVQVVPVTELQD